MFVVFVFIVFVINVFGFSGVTFSGFHDNDDDVSACVMENNRCRVLTSYSFGGKGVFYTGSGNTFTYIGSGTDSTQW